MQVEKNADYYFHNKELDIKLLIDDYYMFIKRIIINSTNISDEDIEEIISDVFFVLWKNQDKIEKNCILGPYIGRITKNIVYKKYQNDKRKIKTDSLEENDYEISSTFNIEKMIEEKELNSIVLNNIENLGKSEVDIFIKYYYEDKSIKQISKELNMTKANVKIKLYRTRKKVKKILEKGGIENV